MCWLCGGRLLHGPVHTVAVAPAIKNEPAVPATAGEAVVRSGSSDSRLPLADEKPDRPARFRAA
jgi:hypothetical protein